MSVPLDLITAKKDFDQEGYAILTNFLDVAETRQTRDRLDRFIRESVPSLPANEIFYEIEGQPDMIKSITTLSKQDSYFHDLFHCERFLAVAAQMLNEPASTSSVHLLNKVPRIGKQIPPHQDAAYLKIPPGKSVTIWLALDEADENNGAMVYLRGSHLEGLRKHGDTGSIYFAKAILDYQEQDSNREVMVTAQPGDLVVHHAMTVHRTGRNQSDRHRRALIADFIAHSTRPQ